MARRRTEYASSTVGNRYHLLGESGGEGELLDTFDHRERAHDVGVRYIDDYDSVTVFDSMAHPGAVQLWKVATHDLEELERRPAR